MYKRQLLGNTSAYFVRNNKFFLIDAGETVFTKLYEMKLLEQYNDIYIIITHTPVSYTHLDVYKRQILESLSFY